MSPFIKLLGQVHGNVRTFFANLDLIARIEENVAMLILFPFNWGMPRIESSRTHPFQMWPSVAKTDLYHWDPKTENVTILEPKSVIKSNRTSRPCASITV